MQIVILSLTDNIITMITLRTDRNCISSYFEVLWDPIVILVKLFYMCIYVYACVVLYVSTQSYAAETLPLDFE